MRRESYARRQPSRCSSLPADAAGMDAWPGPRVRGYATRAARGMASQVRVSWQFLHVAGVHRRHSGDIIDVTTAAGVVKQSVYQHARWIADSSSLIICGCLRWRHDRASNPARYLTDCVGSETSEGSDRSRRVDDLICDTCGCQRHDEPRYELPDRRRSMALLAGNGCFVSHRCRSAARPEGVGEA